MTEQRQQQQRPITPPPVLVSQWEDDWHQGQAHRYLFESYITYRAAQWGADQELDACCEEMKSLPSLLGIPFGEMASNALRAIRRPEPPPRPAKPQEDN
jgi:hypothetical protein